MTIIWVDCAQLEVLRKKMLVLFFRNKDFSCCLNTVGVLNRCGAPVIDFALVLLYYYIHINIYIYIHIYESVFTIFHSHYVVSFIGVSWNGTAGQSLLISNLVQFRRQNFDPLLPSAEPPRLNQFIALALLAIKGVWFAVSQRLSIAS